MKTKKFRNVVEWDEEPSPQFIFIGTINIISAVLLFICASAIYEYGNIWHIPAFGTATCIFTAIVSLMIGSGFCRKVHWEEIK